MGRRNCILGIVITTLVLVWTVCPRSTASRVELAGTTSERSHPSNPRLAKRNLGEESAPENHRAAGATRPEARHRLGAKGRHGKRCDKDYANQQNCLSFSRRRSGFVNKKYYFCSANPNERQVWKDGVADILNKAFIDVLWRSLLKLRNFKSTNPRKATMDVPRCA